DHMEPIQVPLDRLLFQRGRGEMVGDKPPLRLRVAAVVRLEPGRQLLAGGRVGDLDTLFRRAARAGQANAEEEDGESKTGKGSRHGRLLSSRPIRSEQTAASAA